MTDIFLYFFVFVVLMSILFVIAVFIGGYIRSAYDLGKIHKKLEKYNGIRGNIVAALLGIITPFCSCTTVPIFAGLIESEINFGIAMSFLIASPAVNIAAIVLLAALFGMRVAVLYVSSIFLISVGAGYLFGKMSKERQIKPTFVALSENCSLGSWKEAFTSSFKSFKYFIFIILISAGIGAFIYNYVPGDFMLKVTAGNSLWAIPGSVIAGAFVYSDIILLVPTGYAFLMKGINQGIVMAFLMSAAGISLPSVLLLYKIIKIKPLVYFISVLLLSYTLLGLLFYYI